MNAKHRTGYGVFDITRQVARRIQSEWEMVEQPERRPSLRPATVVIPLPRVLPPKPRAIRPLAA